MIRRRQFTLPRLLWRRLGAWRFSAPRLLVVLLLVLTLMNLAVFHHTTQHRHRSMGTLNNESPNIPPPPVVEAELEEADGAESPQALTPSHGQDFWRILFGRKLDSVSQLIPQESSFVRGFSHSTIAVERERFDELMKQDEGSVMQGSKSFRDIKTYDHHGVLLPKLSSVHKTEGTEGMGKDWLPGALPEPSSTELRDYLAHEAVLDAYNTTVYEATREAVGSAAFCDAADADYTLSKDLACLAYLRNPANWLSLKPMSSILSAGRTIKFLLSLAHGNMTAVMKVSQKRFALEPASEVVAYHMDRILDFRRVPPTIWVQFPVEYIKAAAATLGAFYVQWVDAATLSAKHTKNIRSKCKDMRVAEALGLKKTDCIYVSLQLWMWDVDIAEGSSFGSVLDGLPFAHLDAQTKTLVEAERAKKNEEAHSGEDYRTTRARMRLLASREHWDQLAFDTIIGNADRWEGHNLFALAACNAPHLLCHSSRAKRLQEGKSKSAPRLAYIDQGSSFYRPGLSNTSIFSPFKAKPYCRVHRKTIERLERIALYALKLAGKGEGVGKLERIEAVRAESPLLPRDLQGAAAGEEAKMVGNAIYEKLLRPRLPSRIGHILPHAMLKFACRRVWSILAHRTHCLQTVSDPVKLFY